MLTLLYCLSIASAAGVREMIDSGAGTVDLLPRQRGSDCNARGDTRYIGSYGHSPARERTR
jgi:hypothetical protein